jgi:hypothetical protein
MPDVAVREAAVNIGTPITLAGVVSHPQQFDSEKPAFIILNSGVMHHVGTCRLSVSLARAMAAKSGMLALRFDFSSVGDSANRPSRASLEQLAVDEIREVMNYVQSHYGATRFVLCGLCSGAHNGFVAATADPRVIGLVAYDFHCFPTWKSYLHFYGPRLLKWQHWKSFGQRMLAKPNPQEPLQQSQKELADQRFFEQPLFSPRPNKQLIEADLRNLVGREVGLLLVFTGQYSLDYTYHRQFADCFSAVDFKGLLTLEYYPDASHIFTEPYYQHLLLELTTRWSKTLNRDNAPPPPT